MITEYLYQFVWTQLHNSTLQVLHPVPDCHEGESEEEPESSPKLCHQGCQGVDQLLLLHHGHVQS